MATIHLPPDIKEFLKLLIDNQVEYLLIGGYAVDYHGYSIAFSFSMYCRTRRMPIFSYSE
jgi:hypothetical protein